MNNSMATQESSQRPFPLYYFVSVGPAGHSHWIIFFCAASWPFPLCYFFRWNPAKCHCIIFRVLPLYYFRGFPAKGKRSVQSIFAKIIGILTIGILSHSHCIIFSAGPAGNSHCIIFSAGPAGNSHCIILFRLGELAIPIVLFFGPAGPGWAIVLFSGPGKIK